eukprot:c9610_g1_i3.p1 GENE.c9610_g1_i3~~c9610_g1_i3.p1  ORF type:complete len:1562 (-),score=331.16 c9610_g1_i3:56-4399(-)
MEDQLLISRCVLFCPIIDINWYSIRQAEKHYYNFAVKASEKRGIGILPIFGFSQKFGVQDPRVQTTMRQHECLYAKLDEAQDTDIESLAMHITRHLNKSKQLMERQMNAVPQRQPRVATPERPSSAPNTPAPAAPQTPSRQLPKPAETAVKTSVSLLLTMTEADLSLFGLMGSPGVQSGAQFNCSSVLELINIYESHRFHLEKSAQLLQSLPPLLRLFETDRAVFLQSGWLQALAHTYKHSSSQIVIQALADIAGACGSEMPQSNDNSRFLMQVLINSSKVLASTKRLMDAAIVAGVIRHVTWNSADIKTQAGELGIVAALTQFLPELSSKSDITDFSAVATICLALANLVLDPHNKRDFMNCRGLIRLTSIIYFSSDDFMASAALACLVSLLQGTIVKVRGDTEVIPAVSIFNELQPTSQVLELISRIVLALDSPARSIFASQVLDLVAQQNENAKQVIILQGALTKLHKIIRYCVHTQPLTFGSAVLCKKAVGCLRSLLRNPDQARGEWVVIGGVKSLLALLDNYGHRNEMTVSLQIMAVQCLISLAQDNISHIKKIGDSGGMRKLIGAIRAESDEAQKWKDSTGAPLSGKSIEFVHLAMCLLAVLCADRDNKIRILQAGGAPLLLSFLDTRFPPQFQEQVLETLEASAMVDEKGACIGWSVEDAKRLASFVGKDQASTPATPNNKSAAVRIKASQLAQSDAVQKRLASAITPPHVASLASPGVSPISLVSSQVEQYSPANSRLSSEADDSRRRQKMAGLSLDGSREDVTDVDQATQKLIQMINEMHQIATEFGTQVGSAVSFNEPSEDTTPSQTTVDFSPEVKLLQSQHDFLQEQVKAQTDVVGPLELQVRALRQQVADEENALQDARQRLMLCDQEVDYCQEEIAATDLSLLLMDGDDDMDNDVQSEAPSDISTVVPGEGDDGDENGFDRTLDVAAFGREDDDQELNAEGVNRMRENLVLELELKQQERYQTEIEIGDLENRISHSRLQLEAKESELYHMLQELQRRQAEEQTLAGKLAQAMPSPVAATAPRTITRGNSRLSGDSSQKAAAGLTKLALLKSQMLNEVSVLAANLKKAKSATSSADRVNILASSGTMDTKTVQMMLSEHEKEKKDLLQRLRDAEDRAEAFSSKVVDEHRAFKQMQKVKEQKLNLKLQRVLEVLATTKHLAVIRAFARWRNVTKLAVVAQREIEVDMREKLSAKTVIQKEKEVLLKGQQLLNSRLEKSLQSRFFALQTKLNTAFTKWRLFALEQQTAEELKRINQTQVSMLEKALRTWQQRDKSLAFHKWLSYSRERSVQQKERVAATARNCIKTLVALRDERKRRCLYRWQGFAVKARMFENQQLLNQYVLETQSKEAELSHLQHLAEDRARQIALEKESAARDMEKLREEFVQKRVAMIRQVIRHTELRSVQGGFMKWRRWTRAKIHEELESLQKSMRMFEGS